MTANVLEEGDTLVLDFNKLAKVAEVPGVLPYAVQYADTGEVILVAYVNEPALARSIDTRSAVFWSTSRNELWEKGKTSGETFDLLEVRRYVVDHLGQQDGILIVDETGFVKKGRKSAGVANQYSGMAGGQENQQIGVFLAYSSEAGCAFIDRDLYVPQEWLDEPARCREAGIPPTRPFAIKPQLAQQMLERAFAAAVPAQWVVGDCIYGSEDLRY